MAITTSAVNAATVANSATGASTGTTASANDPGNMFLKLFVQQLKTQDPMSPMDGSQFTTQLAQMTEVQQITTLNNNFASLLRNQQLADASGLIGSTVAYQDANTGSAKSGTVTAARLSNNNVGLVVGQDLVTLSQVTNVTRP